MAVGAGRRRLAFSFSKGPVLRRPSLGIEQERSLLTTQRKLGSAVAKSRYSAFQPIQAALVALRFSLADIKAPGDGSKRAVGPSI